MFARLAVAVLLAGLGAVSIPAYAQQVSITTSADNLGGTFFGEGVLQVIITDNNADASGVIEDLGVNIDADPETGTGGSGSFTIPETSASSGRFEFYLTHVDANDVDPDDIDPINTAGVEGAAGAGSTAAPIITFGAGADLSVAGAEDLFKDVAFTITVDNTEIEVDYEESIAGMTLDRSSYPSGAFVYVSIADNDANLNPTVADEFTVDPASAPNNDLLDLNGGTITQSVVFEETGDNTGVFKGRYQLGSSIDADSESLVLALNEKANYGATLGADENDSNNIVEASFTIGNTDGSIDVNGGQQPAQTYDPVFDGNDSYRIGQTATIAITDPDANVNPNSADSISVTIMAISGDQELETTAQETGANTGIFSLSFGLTDMDNAPSGSITVQNGDTIVVEYLDLKPANNAQPKEFSTLIEVAASGTADAEIVTPSRPALEDITGQPQSSLSVGQQAILSTTFTNNLDAAQPFVALVEVRDSDGVTIFLAWQTGTLNPSGIVDVGLSWTPEKAGDYKVRTFAISDLSSPQVLSPVAESSIRAG